LRPFFKRVIPNFQCDAMSGRAERIVILAPELRDQGQRLRAGTAKRHA